MTPTERGHRIRELRDQHNLSRQQIATLTGASLRAVCHWLVDPSKSEHRSPSEQTLRLLELQLTPRRPKR